MTILAILGILPAIINAVETLFKSFPGSGAVKKQSVLTSIDSMVAAANTLGAKVDATVVSTTAGLLIDNYVGVQNAIGNPAFVKAQAEADHA